MTARAETAGGRGRLGTTFGTVLLVVAVGAIVLAAAWWSQVGVAASLVASGTAVVVFLAVDRWFDRLSQRGVAAAVRDRDSADRARSHAEVNTATASAIGSDVGRRADSHVGGNDPATAPSEPGATVHQPLSGDADPGESGRSDEPAVFWLRIPKHGNSLAECEDAVAWSPDGAAFVVSDGAGSSFGSARWAETLAAHFVESPPTALDDGDFVRWVDRCRDAIGADDDEEVAAAGWWAEEGRRRGAFATLAGVCIEGAPHRRSAVAMIVGDSCVMVVRRVDGSWRLVRAVPFDAPQQFTSRPMLVGSTVDAIPAEPSWTRLGVQSGDLLVVASDAASEWLVGAPARLASFDLAPGDLADRLLAERAAGQIVNDDLAMLGVSIP